MNLKLKVKPEGSKKEIEKIPSRPTGLYPRLGLIPSQTRIKNSALELCRSIIINNTIKEMDSPVGEKEKKGGDREEDMLDSHSTP